VIIALLPFILPVILGGLSLLMAVLAPQLIAYVLSMIPSLLGTESRQIMHFIGFGAWVADLMKLDICLAVIITWMNIRLMIAALPFVWRFVS
jgi:hypothetical protein